MAQFYAALARRDASLLNRDRDYSAAKEKILRTARRIAGYSGEDEVLNELVVQLKEEAHLVGRMMESRGRKRMYSRSTNSLRSKREDGSTMRISLE